MSGWRGSVVGILVLVGLALSAAAVANFAVAELFTQVTRGTAAQDSTAGQEALALRLAWGSWVPFLVAALLLSRDGRRAPAAAVAIMAPLSLLAPIRHDASGLILQIVAVFVAIYVTRPEDMPEIS